MAVPRPTGAAPSGGPTTLVPVASPEVRTVPVGDQLVLVDPSAGTSHVLNAGGAAIWTAIDGATSVDDLAARLVARHGSAVDREQVDDFVVGLRARGLVTVAGTSDRPPREAKPAVVLREPRPWPAGVEPKRVGPVRAGRALVEVRTDDARVAEIVARATTDLPAPGRAGADAPPHLVEVVGVVGDRLPRYSVAERGRTLAWCALPEEAADRALAHVNALVRAEARGTLRLHAAAAERDGRVVVVAGPSGTGKSTLAAALVGAGFGYLTDEVVVVEGDELRVVPYPRAIDLAVDTAALLGVDGGSGGTGGTGGSPGAKAPVPASSLGRTSTGGRLALVVLLEPAGTTETAGGAPLEPVAALLGLLPNVFAESYAEDGGVQVLARIAASVPVHRLPRRSPDRSVAAVCELLG